MTEPIKPETISAVLGSAGPDIAVRQNWPLLFAALTKNSIDDLSTQIAVIATVGVETGCFAPIKERGGPAYFTKLYEGRADLGNLQPGDGARFRGRGYVQITGRANYVEYGRAIGVDLAGNPDLALDAAVAAEVLALYFRNRNIPKLAGAGKWESVRRKVNGGLNGWARFLQYVQDLSKASAIAHVDTMTLAAAEQKPVDDIEQLGLVGDVQV